MGTPDNKTTLRLLYYPVIDKLKEGQLRLGEHTDYGTITLLFQDQIGGLEVWTPEISSSNGEQRSGPDSDFFLSKHVQ